MRIVVGLILSACLSLAHAGSLADNVRNFHQHHENLATGGELTEQAVPQLAAEGYVQIIDLRTPAERQFDEQAAAAQAGIAYANLPTTGELPDADQIAQFGALLTNGKTLVHCRSGNRVGMTWALWQLSQGVAMEQALEEGRAMGMKQGFEDAIRARVAAGKAE
ncbi:beta-lactamase hydrolase domain-containing protein [Simiduia agarivorans]|uniref:Beta-lactamase hydrolase-like protein phosphatase-like domain-containing protein n=1 Tax=Simiduia agarivorans (strain DSM 21679 / JCM 13881 / BCRC 17597 / SA1) TaxID=1117647 RepID=K4KNR4_SIMAS|nr:sulfur transferase domain-containing protein [Simiduia agarivorans]AFV00815.1 hypothetical protein M5M_18430 [Simiduia agarivorans SA1 = DSM 21679]